MKSVCQYDGIKLYRPVTDGEKKLFVDMLLSGSRANDASLF